MLQLNPKTGPILRRSTVLKSLDGLIFDPSTRKLFATSYEGKCLYALDPANLAAGSRPIATPAAKPDGLASDAKGNIFIAALGNNHIYRYSIANGTFSSVAVVESVDDIAPLVGLGAPPTQQ